MKMVESVGMLAVGAVVASAVFWAVSDDSEPKGSVSPGAMQLDDESKTASERLAEIQDQSNEVQNASEEDASATASQQGAADRIHSIISQAEDVIDSEKELTPEQEQVVAFFQRVARDRNAEAATDTDAPLNFDNLTIHNLDVRYYYTTKDAFSKLDIEGLLAQQKALVQSNICTQQAIRSLIEDYGITYNYRFISKDYRFVGEVSGDVSQCP